MHSLTEQNIYLFLVQILLLLGLARALGEVFRLWHQPPLTAEILVGLLLGPTVLGRLWPEFQQNIFPSDPVQIHMLETVSWLGVFFLLLESGLEIDFISAWRQRRDALKLAIADVIIPFIIIFSFSFFIPDSYLEDPQRKVSFALFIAAIMSVTALTIVVRVLQDLSLNKTDFGSLVLAALSVNDVLGWIIFTIVLVIFTSGQLDIYNLLIKSGYICLFIYFALTWGRRWTEKVLGQIRSRNMPEPSSSLTFICLLGILCGALTLKIGIHALLGFLMAGIMAGGSKALSERTRHIISQMVYAIFVPLFFTSIGLKIDFLKNFEWQLVLAFLGVSVLAKFTGAWIGVKFTSLTKDVRLPVAILHVPGGIMEVVIGMFAFEHKLITEQVFVSIVFTAVSSSILIGPWFSYSIKRRKQISVLEYFSKRAILSEFKINERELAIASLVERLCLEPNMPMVEVVIDAVLSRERSTGTALEEGVAVPHARLTGLSRPAVAFGRSTSGIDWDAADGKPTHFVFLILTSDKDDGAQIQILRSIARAMADEAIRKKLICAQDKQGIWDVLNLAFTHQSINQ